HHLSSVLLHTANSILLFLVLKLMTRETWPSVAVAALFAWHPLHVESVAWVAERKDVLSGLFWMLTLWAYVKYVDALRGPPNRGSRSENGLRSRWFYILALVFFALGLMSKPMLVTLPFVLLLLDYWPLQRWSLPPTPGPSPSEVRGSRLFSLLQSSSATIRSSISLVLGRSTGPRELPGLLWEKA